MSDQLISLEKAERIFSGNNSDLYYLKESSFGEIVVKVLKDEFPDIQQIRQFYNEYEISQELDGGDLMTTITISSRVENGDMVITCEDNGVGIIEHDKTQLFTKGFGKHTGLGLYLIREIMSITGITITENGDPGNGARFEITVPKGVWRLSDGGVRE